jgi:uncharacterized protein YndB with AHSA1/START domain
MTEQSALTARVVKTVAVPLPPEAAFELFTAGMAQWWPLETHSVAADTHEGRVRAETVTFEPGPSGRIIETMSDGSQCEWGRVQAWDPPHRVAFSWKPNLGDGPATHVEVTFSPTGTGTLVELVHTGWEAFGPSAEDRRRGYDTGWEPVLRRLVAAAGG